MRIEVGIATKDRYPNLALLLWSLLEQTHKDFCVSIIDDSDDRKDIRELPYMAPILIRMDQEGHSWYVNYGVKKGPVHSFQTLLEQSRYPFVLITDDDSALDSRCIEYLVGAMTEGVAAVGAVVINPVVPPEIRTLPYGYKWFKKFRGFIDEYGNCDGDHHWKFHPDDELQETDHFQCMLYRLEAAKEIGGFDLNYDPSGFRGETDFCYAMFKKGWKLYLHPKALSWHFQDPVGGLRKSAAPSSSYQEANEYYLKKFGFKRGQNTDRVVKIYGGLGDHLCATPLIRALKKKGKVTIAAVYPYMFIGNPNVDEIITASEEPRYLKIDMKNSFEWAYQNQFWGKLSESFCRTYSEPYDGDKLDYVVLPEEREWANSLGLEKPFVVLAPWGATPPVQYDWISKTGASAKMTVIRDWFKDRYVKLVKEIQSLGVKVIQIGGMGEEEIEICDRHIFGEEYRKVIAILEQSETFIGVDSFIQHAGHAIDKRGVVLFGPSDPFIAGHDTNINIKTFRCDQGYACISSKNPKDQWTFKAKDCKTRLCMKSIKVPDVLKAVKLLLNDKKT